MLESLKEAVLAANLELQKSGLVIFTWGNVSAIDREKELVVIKPSGLPYQDLTMDKMVVVDLAGKIIEGNFKPSSDTATHLELYRGFKEIGGVAHTHSPRATSWAQAQKGIPCFGTTHADYFYQEIPCSRAMTPAEIKDNYELNTGKVILERFTQLNYLNTPGILVAGHGPFTWGKTPAEAVENSIVLEEISGIALDTLRINPLASGISAVLMDKHFFRKHGAQAYYGQDCTPHQ